MSKFIKGMDLSSLLEVERCGGRFYDDGKEIDILKFMKDKDVDTIINNGMAICRILGLKMYEYGLAAQKGPR